MIDGVLMAAYLGQCSFGSGRHFLFQSQVDATFASVRVRDDVVSSGSACPSSWFKLHAENPDIRSMYEYMTQPLREVDIWPRDKSYSTSRVRHGQLKFGESTKYMTQPLSPK
jgi:hypothetical protein